MRWINVEDALPINNSYVLVYLKNMPWIDEKDKNGKRFYKVVRFIKGKRSEEITNIITSSDQWGNNLKPYCWKEFGPSTYFGQEVDYWMEIPLLPEACK